MRLPKQARSTFLLAAAALVGACSGEVTSPTEAGRNRPIEARSKFVPDAASKIIYGIADGTYTFKIDPTQNQSLPLGPNRLDLPANSVCDLTTSGYGPSTWNLPCTPQVLPVTITVIVKNAAMVNSRMDFFPAMRFNPAKDVQLYMYFPNVSATDMKTWTMLFCPDIGSCIDESVADLSLVSKMDREASVLFRRIKHFSGYAAAEFKEDGTPMYP